MDLREEALKEHSKKQTLKMTAWIGNNEDRFRQYLYLFLHDEYRVVQRISWVLCEAAEHYPKLVEENMGVIIKRLGDKDIHTAVKRNVIRVLQFLNIPKKYHAKVFNLCVNYLSDPNEAIAVRVFSISVATRIAAVYPELANEVIEYINVSLKNSTAGLRSRSRKELSKLKKLIQ
ncbi:MAG: hypothetical protein ABI543_11335 [Ignavibacteria bacterium]